MYCRYIIPAFDWRDRGISRNTSVVIVYVPLATNKRKSIGSQRVCKHTRNTLTRNNRTSIPRQPNGKQAPSTIETVYLYSFWSATLVNYCKIIWHQRPAYFGQLWPSSEDYNNMLSASIYNERRNNLTTAQILNEPCKEEGNNSARTSEDGKYTPSSRLDRRGTKTQISAVQNFKY
jgi:hypothetical protein